MNADEQISLGTTERSAPISADLRDLWPEMVELAMGARMAAEDIEHMG